MKGARTRLLRPAHEAHSHRREFASSPGRWSIATRRIFRQSGLPAAAKPRPGFVHTVRPRRGLAPDLTALEVDLRSREISVQRAGARPIRVAARGARPSGDGRRGSTGRGKDRQTFSELGRMAARTLRNGTRTNEGFKLVSAGVARVFVNWHVWLLANCPMRQPAQSAILPVHRMFCQKLTRAVGRR